MANSSIADVISRRRNREQRRAPQPPAAIARSPCWSCCRPTTSKMRCRPLLDSIQAALEPAGIPYRVIVVDDGSRDGTGRVAERKHRSHMPVELVTHDKNQGLAAAIRTGLTRRARPLRPQRRHRHDGFRQHASAAA